MFKLVLEVRGTRDQIANIQWLIEKAREFQGNIYFCSIYCTKAFDCVDHNKLWKILKEMGIPDHLTCLFRNLYASQAATVRTRHGTMDWFQIGKKSTSRLYIVILFIWLICRVHLVKYQTGWSTLWNRYFSWQSWFQLVFLPAQRFSWFTLHRS